MPTAALLKHVSGINTRVGNAIVKYREEHGPFTSRQIAEGLGSWPCNIVQALAS